MRIETAQEKIVLTADEAVTLSKAYDILRDIERMSETHAGECAEYATNALSELFEGDDDFFMGYYNDHQLLVEVSFDY